MLEALQPLRVRSELFAQELDGNGMLELEVSTVAGQTERGNASNAPEGRTDRYSTAPLNTNPTSNTIIRMKGTNARIEVAVGPFDL